MEQQMLNFGRIMAKIVLALIEKDGSFLIIKRKKPLLGLLWAFPGGIQKEGETEEDAVVRESKEEVGLDVEVVGNKLFEWKHPKTLVQTSYFHCRQTNTTQNADIGEPYEIEELEWVSSTEVFQKFTTESHQKIREFVLGFSKR